MDSLILSHQSIHPFHLESKSETDGHFICQASDKETYIISQNQITLIFVRKFKMKIIDHLQDSQQFLTEPLDAKVSSVKYLSELNQICISTQTELYLFSLDSFTLENVGSIDSGILGVAWSEDEELVVIITGNRTALELNNAFQLI